MPFLNNEWVCVSIESESYVGSFEPTETLTGGSVVGGGVGVGAGVAVGVLVDGVLVGGFVVGGPAVGGVDEDVGGGVLVGGFVVGGPAVGGVGVVGVGEGD
jgi:hypothetical protein